MVETIWQLEGEISRCWWRVLRHTLVYLLFSGVLAWLNPWPGYYLWSLLLFGLACTGRWEYQDEVAFLRAYYGETLAERQRQRAEDAATPDR